MRAAVLLLVNLNNCSPSEQRYGQLSAWPIAYWDLTVPAIGRSPRFNAPNPSNIHDCGYQIFDLKDIDFGSDGIRNLESSFCHHHGCICCESSSIHAVTVAIVSAGMTVRSGPGKASVICRFPSSLIVPRDRWFHAGFHYPRVGQ